MYTYLLHCETIDVLSWMVLKSPLLYRSAFQPPIMLLAIYSTYKQDRVFAKYTIKTLKFHNTMLKNVYWQYFLSHTARILVKYDVKMGGYRSVSIAMTDQYRWRSLPWINYSYIRHFSTSKCPLSPKIWQYTRLINLQMTVVRASYRKKVNHECEKL